LIRSKNSCGGVSGRDAAGLNSDGALPTPLTLPSVIDPEVVDRLLKNEELSMSPSKNQKSMMSTTSKTERGNDEMIDATAAVDETTTKSVVDATTTKSALEEEASSLLKASPMAPLNLSSTTELAPAAVPKTVDEDSVGVDVPKAEAVIVQKVGNEEVGPKVEFLHTGGKAGDPKQNVNDEGHLKTETDVKEETKEETRDSTELVALTESCDGDKTSQGLVVVDGGDDDSAVASRTTPTPTPSSKGSAASSDAANSDAASDDWEKELELDLTDEERNLAEKLLSDGEKLDDDWENWE